MPKREKIEELLEVMGFNENYLILFKQGIDAAQKDLFEYTDISAGEIEDLKRRSVEKMELMKPELFLAIIDLYDAYYNEKEIDDILSFYKSPTGKRMTEIAPILSKENVEMCLTFAAKIRDEVIADIEKEYGTNFANYLKEMYKGSLS